MASDIISTKNMWPNYSAANVATASKKDTQTMGKDQFLKIMITQLQNQDPTQPLEDKEFIAQMAQFTSVEQLMNISTQLSALNQSLGSVSGLIGAKVSWVVDGDQSTGGSSQINSGIVNSIIIRDGVQYASVGDLAIPVTKIIEIANPTEDSTTPSVPDSTSDVNPVSAANQKANTSSELDSDAESEVSGKEI
ncbi:flagellar basal-body rod modification protein FlgD [Paenibacillus sp. DS2015]|uniref:flagellar hook capping FlgD N-terminal domain-containing protein n=1 Tax=Paenibacillus sp. DS2015 TaxID=3373917 RepID=UPI003D194984